MSQNEANAANLIIMKLFGPVDLTRLRGGAMYVSDRDRPDEKLPASTHVTGQCKVSLCLTVVALIISKLSKLDAKNSRLYKPKFGCGILQQIAFMLKLLLELFQRVRIVTGEVLVK